MSFEDTDALKGEFPRSVSMWEWLIEKSPDEKMTAIEKCRKSVKLWTCCLTDLKLEEFDDEDLEEFFNDALDAVGLVHDSLNLMDLIESHIKQRPCLGNKLQYYRSAALRVSNVRSQFDPLMFPENRSSFSMDDEIAKKYLRALTEWPDVQESLLQQLVLEYNDDPGSWQMYVDWLIKNDRQEDAVNVMDTAAETYVAYNPNMKVHAGVVRLRCNQDGTKSFWDALNSPPDMLGYLTCESLEVISKAVAVSEWDLENRFCVGSLQYKWAKYLMWIETQSNDCLEPLLNCVGESGSLEVDDEQLLLFCFAIQKLEKQDANCEKILKLNSQKIFRLFPPESEVVVLVRNLVAEAPEPPRPVLHAPPKPISMPPSSATVSRRVVPGYTPGWLASDYAKKHNI